MEKEEEGEIGRSARLDENSSGDEEKGRKSKFRSGNNISQTHVVRSMAFTNR